MKRNGLFALLILLSLKSWSQEIAQANDGVFQLSYANDFTSFSDKYYTNGVEFSLTIPAFSYSPFNPKPLKKSKYSESYHTLNFQYQVFTPDLKSDLFTDRPFSATMMLGSKHQYVYREKSLRITSELKLGLIGQAAGAGKLQNGLHDIMPGADPVNGWETQVQNDIGINYIIGFEKKLQFIEFVDIIAATSAYLGTPYTKLDLEINIRVGQFEDYFNHLNNNRKRRWQAFITTGIKGSAIAYNATIQGGLLNPNNPYVLDDINHWVMDLNVGIGLAYKNTSLSFVQHFITPEFQGGTSHSWGDLQIVLRF